MNNETSSAAEVQADVSAIYERAREQAEARAEQAKSDTAERARYEVEAERDFFEGSSQ